MAKLLKGTTTNLIVRVCLLLFLLLFLSLLLLQTDTLTFLFDENHQENWNLSEKPFITLQNNCGQDKAFSFIPAATVDKWAKTEFLIVFGIPSVDNDGRRRRRSLQRATCWTFPGVATRANAYSGSLLVLYALARHPAHGFALSESLRLEAAQWHDILDLPVEDGQVKTNKKIGFLSQWDNETSIIMGKKLFFWLQLALFAFSLAVNVGKCDDNMFISVPQYLADIRLVSQRWIYWGPYRGRMVIENNQTKLVDVKFTVGYAVALTRDVADAVVNDKPQRCIKLLPDKKKNELGVLILSVSLDDVIVGRILNKTRYLAVFAVKKIGCMFHNCKNKNLSYNTAEHFIVVHHLEKEEYRSFISYIMKNDINIQNNVVDEVSPTFYWISCLLK